MNVTTNVPTLYATYCLKEDYYHLHVCQNKITLPMLS